MTGRAALLAVLVWVPLSLGARARAAEDDARTLDRVEASISQVRQRLGLVREYVEKSGQPALAKANQRFSEAETQFLLDNFEGCAALLLEVVDVPEFQAGPHEARALYYLAESFYQTQSYLDALRYFRQAVQVLPVGELYEDSIVRLIDLADKTGDAEGVDKYFAVAQAAGRTRPEVTYLYAKWIAKRQDLPQDVRIGRADQEFAQVTRGRYLAPALYFRGALEVLEAQTDEAQVAALQKKDPPEQEPALQAELTKDKARALGQAAGFEEQILALPAASGGKELAKAKNLANLALARILFEEGKLSQAADHYNEVSRNSAEYNEALFETAATFVKMGNYELALQTADILLIIGRDSQVAPNAQVLQGNLQLELKQYGKASATFNDVVSTYSPVYQQIRALLSRPDPVSYFDQLLEHAGPKVDVLGLLPEPARPFVQFDQQVKDAHVIASELSQDQSGIEASRKLARRILDALQSARLDRFPELREGNSLAIEQSNELESLESELVRLEMKLLGSSLPAGLEKSLADLESARERLDQKFKLLPKTQAEYEDRKERFLERIDALDRLAFRLRDKMAELRANLVGLQYYWNSTRAERKPNPELDQERRTEFSEFARLIDQLDAQRQTVVDQIATERETAASQASGGQLEEQLREKYRQQLDAMQELIEKAMPYVPGDSRPLLARVQQARGEIESLQTELASLRGQMRTKADDRADAYRKEVAQQEAVLDGYQRQVDGVDLKSHHLLGAIAYNAFHRVGAQFHDIVLKADVGIIDVAWAKKQDKTDRIVVLGKEKSKAIHRLEERFNEVLHDAD